MGVMINMAAEMVQATNEYAEQTRFPLISMVVKGENNG